jgi:hypothetical protein
MRETLNVQGERKHERTLDRLPVAIAPSSPSTSAICIPSPREPPVMSATRPLRS